MTNSTPAHTYVTSGSFLLGDRSVKGLFTPELFTEEQRMLRQSIRDFLDKEIHAHYQLFDSKEGIERGPALLKKMGDLGFLGIGVPEAYGGFEADFRTQLAFGEVAYAAWSFGLTIGVQTSLGIAPLLLYGNKAQKDKYLPGIVSADRKSCYCLTEPTAGSDANSGKTRARMNEAGTHYLLNGQKMWITNSGFADLFFVFAKIADDEKLSCLIVEKDFGGIRLGAEEEKMGIRGSSTRQVFFEDVPVPLENLLGERGKGFKIALNVLNTGRIKMATTVTGTAKRAMGYAARYASERQQFGQTLDQFDAIQAKLSGMAQRIYAMESIAFRIGGQIDDACAQLIKDGMDPQQAEQKAIASYAMECALAKVHNTEADAWIVDESLQVHGGMGYSAETPIETMYRNQRINRIYEGTNEINRMLSIDMLLRKAMKGQLPLLQEATKARQAIRAGNWLAEGANNERSYLRNARTIALAIMALVGERLLPTLKQEQQLMLALSDVFTELFALESVILRGEQQSNDRPELREALTKLQLAHSSGIIYQSLRTIIPQVAEGSERSQLLDALLQLEGAGMVPVIPTHRTVALVVQEAKGYPFSL